MKQVTNGQTNGHARAAENVELAVLKRYAEGALKKQKKLCCPVTYNPKYLNAIPQEILEKDYGCGDPSAYLKEGEVVLDLGSGAGKICYIASQVVGPRGKVIGIDFNPEMLELAHKYQKEVSTRIGWNNVSFLRGRIQDLKTDSDWVERELRKKSVQSLEDLTRFEAKIKAHQDHHPLIADESVDVIVSNCVLNLVRTEDKKQLFREMHRVLKKGGRIAVSDIVSDEEVPESMQRNPKLWSGCIAGAFQEKAFIRAFEEAGFYGITLEKRDDTSWQTVRGIEFRSVTVVAYKGKEGACWERNQAVIYKGPWKQVEDDDHHVLRRGARTAVCDKTFQIYSKEPYRGQFYFVEPLKAVSISNAISFSATKRSGSAAQFGGDCERDEERDPRETKGRAYRKTKKPESVCMDGGCC